MTRLLLAIILCFFISLQLFSQSFSWQADTTDLPGQPGTTIIFHTYLSNNTAAGLELRIMRLSKQLPGGWSSSFCVGGINGICYDPALDTISVMLSGSGQTELAVDFSTSNLPAQGQISVRIEDVSNTSDYHENIFSVSTAATSLINHENRSGVNFRLYRNYPNPFNPSTTIPFEIGGSGHQRTVITVYSILGQIIRILMNDRLAPGYHQVIWDGRDNQGNRVSSGIYFVELRTENHIYMNKIFLLK
jgi:hypothetical protein